MILELDDEREPHDAHVRKAREIFRAAGFDIGAMRYRRSPEALQALRAFNGLPNHVAHPYAWEFHPNEWCRDNWKEYLR